MFVQADPTTGSIIRVSEQADSLTRLHSIEASVSHFPFLLRHPNRYRVVGSHLVLQPYLDVSATTVTTSPVTLISVKAKAENYGANPPSSIVLSVGWSVISIPISPPTPCVFVIEVHPALGDFLLKASVYGDGIAGDDVVLSDGEPAPPVQIVPLADGSTYLVAPTQRALLRSFYSGILSASREKDTLSQSLQNLYLVDSIAIHALITKIIASLSQSSYTPLSLTADEQNAISDMEANLIPHFLLHLGTIYPAGGERVDQYQSAIDMAPIVAQAALDYANDVATIPNLT